MNDFQIAKLASLKLIVKEAKNNPTVVAQIPMFAKGITRLEAITTKMDELSTQQAVNITGVTNSKNSVMDDLTESLVDIAGALHAHAVLSADQTLLTKVNYKESAISKMSQSELINAAGIVLGEVEKLSPAILTEIGISTDEITEFKAAYTEFAALTPTPREAIIDRSSTTSQLADLFAEASDLKKNTLDRLASQFRRKAPEFYQKYKAAATTIYKRGSKPAPTVEVAP